jgi:hypothetical protein
MTTTQRKQKRKRIWRGLSKEIHRIMPRVTEAEARTVAAIAMDYLRGDKNPSENRSRER